MGFWTLQARSGKNRAANAPFDLRDAVKTTARLFAPNAQAKGLTLEIVVDPILPEWVSGDRHRFAQIVRNLVDNAIKFTEHGGVQVHAGGFQPPDGTFLCQLSVQDTGIGIPRRTPTGYLRRLQSSGCLHHPSARWDRFGVGDLPAIGRADEGPHRDYQSRGHGFRVPGRDSVSRHERTDGTHRRAHIQPER